MTTVDEAALPSAAPANSFNATEKRCLEGQTMVPNSQFPFFAEPTQPFVQSLEQKSDLRHRLSLPTPIEAQQREQQRSYSLPQIYPYPYTSAFQQKRYIPSLVPATSNSYSLFPHPELSPEAALDFFSQAHCTDVGCWVGTSPEQSMMLNGDLSSTSSTISSAI
jgi:hypothetical protein